MDVVSQASTRRATAEAAEKHHLDAIWPLSLGLPLGGAKTIQAPPKSIASPGCHKSTYKARYVGVVSIIIHWDERHSCILRAGARICAACRVWWAVSRLIHHSSKAGKWRLGDLLMACPWESGCSQDFPTTRESAEAKRLRADGEARVGQGVDSWA